MAGKLIGRTFNRLRVKYALETDKHRKAYFCCLCKCGATVRVRGDKLLTGRQKSCGCYRADPAVRREARLKVPAAKRLKIAEKGAQSVQTHHGAGYTMDAHRAADILGVSIERVEVMARDGVLPHKWRKGALFVSSQEVAYIAAEQCRQKKRCTAEHRLMFQEPGYRPRAETVQ